MVSSRKAHQAMADDRPLAGSKKTLEVCGTSAGHWRAAEGRCKMDGGRGCARHDREEGDFQGPIYAKTRDFANNDLRQGRPLPFMFRCWVPYRSQTAKQD